MESGVILYYLLETKFSRTRDPSRGPRRSSRPTRRAWGESRPRGRALRWATGRGRRWEPSCGRCWRPHSKPTTWRSRRRSWASAPPPDQTQCWSGEAGIELRRHCTGPRPPGLGSRPLAHLRSRTPWLRRCTMACGGAHFSSEGTTFGECEVLWGEGNFWGCFERNLLQLHRIDLVRMPLFFVLSNVWVFVL